jgi:hypothetical protein
MLVPENLAGKKGRCKACQQILTVPPLPAEQAKAQAAKPSTPPVPAAPKLPSAPPPPVADVEAEAAALFADEPKPTEPVETKTIDLNCPFCDEAIHFPVDLAGKRAPCPECKQIIKVPEPLKKDPKDWRKVEVRGPSGARRPDQPTPEGAWGSATASTVAKQSLVEAGVLPTKELPRTTWQKMRWPILGVSLALLLSVGGWWGYRWWGQRAADSAVQEALAYADSPEAKPATKAALAMGAGAYYLHTGTVTSAEDANKQFGKALSALRSAPQGDDRDVLSIDLAFDFIELSGDTADVDKGHRLPWDKTQPLLRAALAAIHNGEARLQTLRLVAKRLRERGQTARILPLTNQLYPSGDGEKNADRAAALAVVGMEFFKADDRPTADKTANEAIEFYKSKTPPPLRAEVVALAQLVEMKKPPPVGDAEDDKANEHIGKVEALARQGELDKAREAAKKDEFGEVTRFRARLAVAAAAVDAKVPDHTDLENVLKLAESRLGAQRELSWSMFRLTQLALRAGLPAERVQALADNIGNRAVRGQAQLTVFRAHLEQTKQAVEEAAADKVEADTPARWLAAQALARHNARYNGSYANVVQGWPQPLKSFGALGVALGLQDGRR